MTGTTVTVRSNVTPFSSDDDDILHIKRQERLTQVTLYPSVPAILMVDEVTTDTSTDSPMPEASYASAHILLDEGSSDDNDDDDEASLESRRHPNYAPDPATGDTTCWVTALALDPWDKEPTASSILDNNTAANTTDAINAINTQLLIASLTSSSQEPTHPSALPSPPQAQQQVAVATIVLNPAEYYTATDAAGESLLAKKMRRRRRRRVRMIFAGFTGFVAGAAILGPIGAYVGAAGGAALAHGASKRGERRKDRRVAKRAAQQLELQQQQQQPPESATPQLGPLPQALVH